MKAKELLEVEVERVRRNLNDDKYKTIDAVLEDVESLKSMFKMQGP